MKRFTLSTAIKNFINTILNLLTLTWVIRELVFLPIMYLLIMVATFNYFSTLSTHSYHSTYFAQPKKTDQNLSILKLEATNISSNALVISSINILPPINWQITHQIKIDTAWLSLGNNVQNPHFELGLKKALIGWQTSAPKIKIPIDGDDYLYPFETYKILLTPKVTFSGSSSLQKGKRKGVNILTQTFYPQSSIKFNLSNTYLVKALYFTTSLKARRGNILYTVPKNSYYITVSRPLWYKLLVIIIICFSLVPIFLLLRKKKNIPSGLNFFAYIATITTFRAWLFGFSTKIHMLDLVFLMMIMAVCTIMLWRGFINETL